MSAINIEPSEPESPVRLTAEQQIRLESMRMATTAFKDYHLNGRPWGAEQFVTVARQFEEYIK